jgi:hypothetical protein
VYPIRTVEWTARPRNDKLPKRFGMDRPSLKNTCLSNTVRIGLKQSLTRGGGIPEGFDEGAAFG